MASKQNLRKEYQEHQTSWKFFNRIIEKEGGETHSTMILLEILKELQFMNLDDTEITGVSIENVVNKTLIQKLDHELRVFECIRISSPEVEQSFQDMKMKIIDIFFEHIKN